MLVIFSKYFLSNDFIMLCIAMQTYLFSHKNLEMLSCNNWKFFFKNNLYLFFLKLTTSGIYNHFMIPLCKITVIYNHFSPYVEIKS